MSHGGDIYEKDIIYDFSVSINPMGAPAEVRDALKASLEHISEYPDIKQRRLKKALSAAEGCSVDEVLGGGGSSGIFSAIVQMTRPETALLINPCFSGYEYALKTVKGCSIRHFEEKDMYALADSIDADTDIVFIANPNNPTGRSADKALLMKIAKKCGETGTCLVVDECFLPLSEHQNSLSHLAVKSRNLFVVRSFTKTFAIPGIRIGYVVSSAENILRLGSFLPEWDLSVPAIEAGIACAGLMKSGDFLRKSYDLVKKERDFLVGSLLGLGFEVLPSDTCFLLFKAEEELYERLLDKGILIRDCSDFKGLNKGWYRISVKDREANQSLIRAVTDLNIFERKAKQNEE